MEESDEEIYVKFLRRLQTCVDEIDNCNNNGGIDLVEEGIAVQIDSADIITVLLEGMPARICSSQFFEFNIQ